MNFIQKIVDEVEALRLRQSNQNFIEAVLTQKLIELDSMNLSGEFKEVNYQCRKAAISFLNFISASQTVRTSPPPSVTEQSSTNLVQPFPHQTNDYSSVREFLSKIKAIEVGLFEDVVKMNEFFSTASFTTPQAHTTLQRIWSWRLNVKSKNELLKEIAPPHEEVRTAREALEKKINDLWLQLWDSEKRAKRCHPSIVVQQIQV